MMKGTSTSSVLVTGGTGAIGTWVVRNLLERGIHPVVYDVFPPGKYLADVANRITFVEGSTLDLDKLTSTLKKSPVQCVIHMAKFTPQEKPLVALENSVMGTARVLEAARVNGVKRVLFTSSKSSYGYVENQGGETLVITEDYPKFDMAEPRFISYYTCTNTMVEYFGIRFAMDFNMEFVITRFGATFGPNKLEMRRRSPLVTAKTVGKQVNDVRKVGGEFACAIIDWAIEGKPLRHSEGLDHKDNLVYYKDVADGVVLSAISDRIRFTGNHREFHFDAGRVYTYRELIEATRQNIPGADIELGPGVLTGGGAPELQAAFDLSRGRDELGYSPRYTDLTAAVADYIEMRKKFDPLAE